MANQADSSFPQPVKNVKVYPYIPVGPDVDAKGPVVFAVLTNGAGTYAVGTLMLNQFFNLNLSSAKVETPLQHITV